MNIMAGLMAGANFGTGFQNGQMNAVQLQAQKLALANAQVLQQQQAQKAQQQQELSDYAMQNFTSNVVNPVTGQPIGSGAVPAINSQTPGTPSPEGAGMMAGVATPPIAAPTDPMDNTIAHMDALANKAASIGDLDHYTELSTNATNLRLAQSNMQEHGASAQLAEAKRQQINYNQIAGMFSDLDPTSPTFTQDFKERQLAAERLPTTTPEEAKNISSWQPSPSLLQGIVQGGMSASQRAAEKHQQLLEAEKKRMDDFHVDLENRKLKQQQQQFTAKEKDKQVGAKVGKIIASPTENDISTASGIVGPIIFPGQKIDTDNPDYNQALHTLAARAKAYQQQHTSVPYTTALSTVAQQAKDIGEFTPTTQETGGILGFGQSTEAGPTKFSPKGDNPKAALPLPGNPKDPKSYVPNKYYNIPGHGPMMWVVKPNGEAGFDPNS